MSARKTAEDRRININERKSEFLSKFGFKIHSLCKEKVFEGLKRRGFLFSHFLYYSLAQHFSKLLGTKSLSFGKYDQELKSELGKSSKFKVLKFNWNLSDRIGLGDTIPTP